MKTLILILIVVIIASALGFLAYSSFLRNNYVVSNEVPYGGGMMGGMMGGYRGGMFYYPFIIAIPSLILGLVGSLINDKQIGGILLL